MIKLISWLATIIIHALVFLMLFWTPITPVGKKEEAGEVDFIITEPSLIESSVNGVACPKTYRGIGVMINFGSLRVIQIVKGGPADRAGVQLGDIIMDDYFQLYPVGAEINIEVIREGATLHLKTTIDNICYE